jgi:4-amino-4-deoxy-L-arabinose transferase-like glycosyltransferase
MIEAKKTPAPIALILLICMIVRLGYVLSLEKHPPNPLTDGYAQIAENILAGKGFSPTPMRHWFFRTPGYPLFIAAVWSIVPTPARFFALEVAQVALSVATCGLLYVIANSVFGRRAALAGAFLFAISPSYTLYCTDVITETLLLFCVALAALLASMIYRSARATTAACFGLIWGIAGLTRGETTVLLPLLLLPVLVAKDLGTPPKIKACAVAALGKAAIMAPWVARNYLIYGAIVLHVPLGGNGLFAGTYPHPPLYGRGRYGAVPNYIHFTQTKEYCEITRSFWDPEFVEQSAKLSDPDVVLRDERDVLEVDRRLAAAAWANIRNYKAVQVYNVIYHIHGLWGRPAGWDHEMTRPLKLAWFGFYLGFLAILVLGIFTAWRSGRLGAIPVSWLVFLGVHNLLLLLFCTDPRYQAASAIFLYTFSGLGVEALLPSPAHRVSTGVGSEV